MEALREFQLLGPVPSRIVEEDDDGLVRAGPAGLGEGIDYGLEQRGIDSVGEPPLELATARADEAIEVEPLVLVAAHGSGPGADFRPDPAAQRLQAEAVFVKGPDFERSAGRLRPRRSHCLAEFFLNAAASSGPAAPACRGRGRCRENASRWR